MTPPTERMSRFVVVQRIDDRGRPEWGVCDTTSGAVTWGYRCEGDTLLSANRLNGGVKLAEVVAGLRKAE